MNPAAPQGPSIRQTFNGQIEISQNPQSHHPSAVYRFGDTPKPCVHPLLTPAGHCLTGFQMSDHVWHRGLWFTIKLLNGTNFWEEKAQPYGIQSTVEQPACTLADANLVPVSHKIAWTSEPTAVAFHEARSISFRQSASGIGIIDWTTKLLAAQDLLLDRTPFTTWGGYGGMSFRGSRELHDVSFMIPSGETITALTGQPHDWAVMQAAVDGGAARRVSLGIIDHPQNPRSPTPWYCKCANGFNFMNAAFLFHEPMNVRREQTLEFRYRIIYRDGTWTASEFAALAVEFRA